MQYAIEMIKLYSIAIEIKTSKVCLPSYEKENYLPLLYNNEKVVDIDVHTSCVGSRLIAEAKALIDKAREETQNQWFTYRKTITLESIVWLELNLEIQFGLEDADPDAMFHFFEITPTVSYAFSGTIVQCDGWGIDSSSKGSESSSQEVYHKALKPSHIFLNWEIIYIY